MVLFGHKGKIGNVQNMGKIENIQNIEEMKIWGIKIIYVKQGGIIPGNQGTRFPGNPNVSQEILIVNPAHLLRNWNTRIR